MADIDSPFALKNIPDYGKASAGDLLLYCQRVATFDDQVDYRICSVMLAGMVSLLVNERDKLKERLREESSSRI